MHLSLSLFMPKLLESYVKVLQNTTSRIQLYNVLIEYQLYKNGNINSNAQVKILGLQGYRHPLFTSIDNRYFQMGPHSKLNFATNAESKVYVPNLVTYLDQKLIFEYCMFKGENFKMMNDHY